MNLHFQNCQWSHGSGEVDNIPTHVSRNESLLECDPTQFPYNVVISLVFDKGDDGLPVSDEEYKLIDHQEEIVAEWMWTKHNALFGLVVTSDGFRDLFFFGPSEIKEPALEKELSDLDPGMTYDFTMTTDPTWEPYYSVQAEP